MQQIIYEKTGSYSQLIRFEGGTNNAGYLARALPGGMQELYELMHSMGLRVFDWNLEVDTAEKTNVIINNFKYTTQPLDYVVTVQQNFRRYSILAIPKIVKWAKNQGCTFTAIKSTYPEVLMN